MPRINVYVPEDLKEKMEERDDINWSKLFQDMVKHTLDLYPVKRDILYVASRRH